MPSVNEHLVVLSTGSNLSEPVSRLETAARIAEYRIGPLKARSAVYRSPAWGFDSQYPFYNQCLELTTGLLPEEVLHICLDIERDMGRIREGHGYTDRIIDIDLLFYDDLVLEQNGLLIPHPRIGERRFVLLPLHEILPLYIHPGNGMTVEEMLRICTDPGDVTALPI